jgi:hypothetical protein
VVADCSDRWGAQPKGGKGDVMRRGLVGVLAILIVCGLAGGTARGSSLGSSSNGIGAKSADQIVLLAIAAARNARSVHYSLSSSQLQADVYVVAGRGGRGSISQNGLRFDLLRIGPIAYFKGSDRFLRHFAGELAVRVFHGRWFKASATRGQFASFTSLTDLGQLIGNLGSHGKLVKSGTTTIDGQAVIGVRDTTQGGTLYVATAGPPYPLAIRKTGSSGGSVIFDRWNQTFSLSAPPHALDYAKLKSK